MRIKWQDNPKVIKKIREAMKTSVVIFPYRRTKVFFWPMKEKSPLPYRLFFSPEEIKERLVALPEVNFNLLSQILEKLFPASLIFRTGDKEYSTLLSETLLTQLFTPGEEIYFSEWEGDEEFPTGKIEVEPAEGRVFNRPFTVLDIRKNPFVLEKKGEVGIYDIEEVIGEKIKLAPSLFFSVLLVCTGNTCRSPMAKGILETMLKDSRVFIYSAGTDGLRNSPASASAVQVVTKLGGNISRHLSQPLTSEMIENADLILVMEKRHMIRIIDMVPEAKNKTFILSAYPEREGNDIIDPIGLSYETFWEIGREMKIYLERIAQDIRERLL